MLQGNPTFVKALADMGFLNDDDQPYLAADAPEITWQAVLAKMLGVGESAEYAMRFCFRGAPPSPTAPPLVRRSSAFEPAFPAHLTRPAVPSPAHWFVSSSQRPGPRHYRQGGSERAGCVSHHRRNALVRQGSALLLSLPPGSSERPPSCHIAVMEPHAVTPLPSRISLPVREAI